MTGPGTVAVVGGTLARYPTFARSLVAMAKPPGTQLRWMTGVSIAEGRNEAIRGRSGEWVFMVDDDHEFAPDTLMRLLADEKEVVVPAILNRLPPHVPVMYDRVISKEEAARDGVAWGYHARMLTEGPPGLVRIHAAGTGCMLIRESVWGKIEDPWFEVGQIRSDQLSEDLWFCEKLARAGVELWADTRVRLSHVTPVAVWPVWHDNRWFTGYQFDGGPMMLVQPAERKEKR